MFLLQQRFAIPTKKSPSPSPDQARPPFRDRTKMKKLLTNVEARLIPKCALCKLPCLFVSAEILSHFFQTYFLIWGVHHS